MQSAFFNLIGTHPLHRCAPDSNYSTILASIPNPTAKLFFVKKRQPNHLDARISKKRSSTC